MLSMRCDLWCLFVADFARYLCGLGYVLLHPVRNTYHV